MTIKQFDPNRYGDYTRGEVVYIIKLSAALQPIEDIVDKFWIFTGKTKKIRGSVVQEIQADFSARITREAEVYLKNIEGNPLSQPRVVLDMCWDIIKDCRKPVPSHTVKVADNQYEMIEKSDNDTALKALKLATDYLNTLKKIQIEENKQKPPVVLDNSGTNVNQEEMLEWDLS